MITATKSASIAARSRNSLLHRILVKHPARNDVRAPIKELLNVGILVHSLSKRYGAFQAVKNVSFEVPAGQPCAPRAVWFGQEHDSPDHCWS